MALKELDWNPRSTKGEGAALVPARVLAETAKSMTAGETVTLSLSSAATGDGLIGFEGTGAAGVRQITTRLLDGEFPKVRHLMNVQATLTVRANTAEVIAAVKRVGLVAERNTSLRMLIGDGSITLEAATGDQAQAVEALEAVVDGATTGDDAMTAGRPSTRTTCPTRCRRWTAPTCSSRSPQPGKPCLLTGLNELDGEPMADYKHVIMLMRSCPRDESSGAPSASHPPASSRRTPGSHEDSSGRDREIPGRARDDSNPMTVPEERAPSGRPEARKCSSPT